MAAVLGLFTPIFRVSPAQAAEKQGKKPLIVYFSMPETDNPQNMTREEENSTVVINGKVLGNTQYMAQLIQEMTGGDIFRILPQKPYPTDHRTLVDLAREEQEQDARPAIVGKIEEPEAYDTIFIGYPNWWGDMPMILYTFLEQYDFSGKTLIPFCTHGGSGFSRTIRTMQDKQPGATVIRNGLRPFPEPYGTGTVRRGGMAEGNWTEKIRKNHEQTHSHSGGQPAAKTAIPPHCAVPLHKAQRKAAIRWKPFFCATRKSVIAWPATTAKKAAAFASSRMIWPIFSTK